MAPIPTRIPPPEDTPSRDEQRRELIIMLAKGRVAAAKKEEAKQAQLQNINRPQPDPNRSPDVFDLAKADAAARAEFEAAVMKQLDAELAAIERQARIRRKHFQIKMRALAALKGYRK